MPGIDDPSVIDAVTQTAEGEVVLIISHDRPWTDDPDEVDRLGDKISSYAAFVLGDGFASAYPQAADRPRRVQLDCVGTPTPRVADLLVQAETAFAAHGVPLSVVLRPVA